MIASKATKLERTLERRYTNFFQIINIIDAIATIGILLLAGSSLIWPRSTVRNLKIHLEYTFLRWFRIRLEPTHPTQSLRLSL
jgi:hypothetical protein